ncbi:hypothetical protein [Tenacibaculum agarivorans]|uniref:hypothetical protein n=1 Tax=Tenacibaculum agarivorans TaxID=1908389 RepID=UPI00094BB22B|nr:hypothetical protein [Tenacibaculum agarivorans]
MKKLFLSLLALAFVFTSCNDDEEVVVTNAGKLEGGPFTFFVDGKADNVSGVTVTGSVEGANTKFIVTDDKANILGLPGDIAALEGVNFDDAGVGVCLIWHIAYEDGLVGLEMGKNANDLSGNFDLSNSITVNREGGPVAGTLKGGPFTFVAGDGTPDNVSGITIDGTPVGTNSSYIVTDDQGKILGKPGTLEMLEGNDFDGAGVGKCLIWYIRYEDGLQGFEVGNNASDIQGVFSLSNSIVVDRVAQPVAGALTGGPFTFVAGDGTPDNVSGIAVTGSPVGSKSSFIVTDDMGGILGMPPTLAALEANVDFDGAGIGKCLIWYIRYEGELEGFEMGKKAGDIKGIFALSNSIDVDRVAQPVAGTLTGGPFTFTVGDGTPDKVTGIAVTGSPTGSKSSFIVTDDMGTILGMPPTLAALEANVDFDGAGVGKCLIWYMRYEGELEGFEMGKKAGDIKGVFALSNSIDVDRVAP